MAWVHPAIGATGALLVIWIGFQGLRSRQKRPGAAASRVTHRKWAPRAWAVVLAAALGGPTSILLFRRDLRLVDSYHFGIGLLVATLMTAGWFTSRQPRARAALWQAHPYIGIAAMLGAGWALLLGLGLLP